MEAHEGQHGHVLAVVQLEGGRAEEDGEHDEDLKNGHHYFKFILGHLKSLK